MAIPNFTKDVGNINSYLFLPIEPFPQYYYFKEKQKQQKEQTKDYERNNKSYKHLFLCDIKSSSILKTIEGEERVMCTAICSRQN